MSYTDVVSRVSEIQAQITSLQTAFDPSVASATTPGAGGAGPASTGSATSSTFAQALAQAQDVSSNGGALPAGALPGGALPAGALPGGALPTGGGALPAGAQSRLTSGQQQFASRLASQTGLDPSVISAWLLAEESGGAAQSRQAQNNNDWLNIGYTDSGTFGSADSVWSNPITAADATAGWLKGQNTIPGYGTASSGIQAILGTAGQPPTAQIAALQHSGWASSGYPSLPSLYQQLAG